MSTLLLLALLTPAPDDDLKAFQGTWQLVHAQTEDRIAPLDFVAKTTVTIDGKEHTVRVGDDVVAHSVAFEVDPGTTPKSVTDTVTDKDGAQHKIRGIYRIEGDILISCVAPADGDRPTSFSAPAGSGRTMRVFRRKGSADHEAKLAAEAKRFEGRWTIKQVDSSGADLTAAFQGHALTVEPGGRFTYTDPNGTTHGVFVAVPAAQGPGAIDLVFADGPQAGKSLPGVYSLTDTTYELAVDPASGRRPASLESPSGSSTVHEVLEREPAAPSR